MTDPREHLLFDNSIGFFGSIVASMTHEMNNVLAIINELSGLLDDFLIAAEQGKPPDLVRQKDLLARIANQILRGTGSAQNLNRFAHSVDDPRVSIDVGESLEQIIILCRRLASLRKIQLDGSPPAQTIKLEGSIFNLQHILFRCVEIALISTAQNSTVHIAVESTDNGARIVVTGGDPVQEVPNIADKASFLAQLVERIGGQLDNSLGTGQPVKLTVILPRCLESISNGPDGESI